MSILPGRRAAGLVLAPALAGSILALLPPAPASADASADDMAAAAMDICPRHLFFRDRSWTRRFFEAADAAAGDVVQVTEAAPYRYAVSLRRRHRA